MAEKLEMTVEDFQDALLEIANSSVLALDDLWTFADPEGGGQISLLDTIHDPNAVDPEAEAHAAELKDRLADAIESLPDRERLVIALYYYENLTLREIGEVLGVTESRVSQLHTKAVLGLRSHFHTPQPAADRPCGPHILPLVAHKPPDRIRNVALIGHRGSGKTSLCRGAAVRGRGRQPARPGRGRLDRLRLRARRAGARDVDRRHARLVRARRTARST